MAASANPSGNQEGNLGTSSYNGVASGGNPSNGNSDAVAENSGPAHTLKHNPGLSTEWTAEEQSILDEGLANYGAKSNIVSYAKIAMQLQDKTVRDVALRLRWMTKKESGKRRKEDHNLARKNKDKKEKVTDPSAKPSQLGTRPIGPQYAHPMIPNDDGISSEAIGGATGHMLEQNAQAFNQISANLAVYQIRENINLFCQARDNILMILKESRGSNRTEETRTRKTCSQHKEEEQLHSGAAEGIQILGAMTSSRGYMNTKNRSRHVVEILCLRHRGSLNDIPGVTNQMPPLPVKVNEELANSILPRTTLPMQS